MGDRLFGEQGRNKIRGNRGNDLIMGEFDKDELTGSQGRDRFAFSERWVRLKMWMLRPIPASIPLLTLSLCVGYAT